MLICQLGEPWVDIPVENIALKGIDHDLSCMDSNRLFQAGKQIVDKDREAGDMVHVKMSDDDVPHVLTLCVAQSDRNAAGIYGHAIVDQIASETLVQGRLTIAIKGAG
jgi:hypothetical protein